MTYHPNALGTAAASGGGGSAGAIANAIGSGFNFAGKLASIAAGEPQKAERAARMGLEATKTELEIAKLQAGGAGAAAAAQIESARIAAEAQAKGSENVVKMVLIGGGVLAALGIGAAVVLKPKSSASAHK